jgi:2-polyprenyl-3-methyl-5-hydroxy-6-metoxy-1,4-benzoquinol methylase
VTTVPVEHNLPVDNLLAEVARLKEHLFGCVNVFLLNTGLELGLFDELRNAGDAGLTVTELARRKGLHEPYLSVWCQCAYGCGYLDVIMDSRFRLARHMETILADTHHPAYLGNVLRLFAAYCSLDLLEYPQYLQTGESFPVQAHGEGFTKLLAQHGLTKGLKFLELVIPYLPRVAAMLQHGASILDIGCGSGTFLSTLARAYPRCRGVGIDSDQNVIQEGARAIVEAGLHDRVRVLCRNAETLIFDNAFDLITMNSVLREVPTQRQADVLASCFTALKPGGTVLITDFALPDTLPDLRDPAHRSALMDMFVEMTWGHRLQTRREQTTLLTQAGFVNVKSQPLGDNIYTLLCGEKPR